jgi:heat-inducible transcriptional repressor
VSLNQRQLQILAATIRHYITTAEPVGSQTLVSEYNLNVSSATIRNGFASLEKAGLLYQPHTSAGRVPSDSGYRTYVDRLITPSPDIGKQLASILDRQVDRSSANLTEVLRSAAQILATVSGYISLISLPQADLSTIRHIQLVPLEVRRVMLVVVFDSYQTHSAIFDLPLDESVGESTEGNIADIEDLTRELQIVSNFLTHSLRGQFLKEIQSLDWSELDKEFQIYATSLNKAISQINKQLNLTNSTQTIVRGLADILRQPEFSELQKAQDLLHLLETDRDSISATIAEDSLGEENLASDRRKLRVTIRIGRENSLKPIQDCALVFSNYYHDDFSGGFIGLLGPKRMLYERVISLVESAATYLSDTLSEPMVESKQ